MGTSGPLGDLLFWALTFPCLLVQKPPELWAAHPPTKYLQAREKGVPQTTSSSLPPEHSWAVGWGGSSTIPICHQNGPCLS